MLDYDEGPQLQAPWLESLGYPLYTETVINKPPLFSWWLETGFLALGRTVAASRAWVLLLNLMGLAALGALAARWFGAWAGVAAPAILLTLPDAPLRLMVVQNDLPSMSLGLLAFLAAEQSLRGRRVVWAAAAGGLLAAAMLVHPLVVFLGPLLLWLLVLPSSESQRGRPADRAWAVAAAAGGGLLIVVAALVPVDRLAMFRWVVLYNLGGAGHASLAEKLHVVRHWWQSQTVSVPVLAVAGLILMLACGGRLGRRLPLVAVWLVLTFGALLAADPLWPHYPMLLAYPVILLLVGSLAGLHGAWSAKKRPRWVEVAFVIVVVLFVGGDRVTRTTPWPHWVPRHVRCLEHLSGRSPSSAVGRFVVTDNQFLAFAASRPVPPPLADTSYKRLSSGSLAEPDVIKSLGTYRVSGLLYDTGRLDRLRGLTEMLSLVGVRPITWGTTRWYPLPSFLTEPQTRVGAGFGEKIWLEGVSWSPSDGARGERLVVLFWRALAGSLQKCVIGVRMKETSGKPVAERVSLPCWGLCPTSLWDRGDLIVDPHRVPSLGVGGELVVRVYTVEGRRLLQVVAPNIGRTVDELRIPLSSQ